MQSVSPILLVSLLLAAPLRPLLGQETATAGPNSCLSDWACGALRAPLGFDVRAVADGGRYLTLEDGSLWEVDISDRATTAAWQPGEFVADLDAHGVGADFDGHFDGGAGMEHGVGDDLAGQQDHRVEHSRLHVGVVEGSAHETAGGACTGRHRAEGDAGRHRWNAHPVRAIGSGRRSRA